MPQVATLQVSTAVPEFFSILFKSRTKAHLFSSPDDSLQCALTDQFPLILFLISSAIYLTKPSCPQEIPKV